MSGERTTFGAGGEAGRGAGGDRAPVVVPTVTQAAAPAAKSDWRGLHLWQIQLVRDVLVVGSVAGLLYLGYVLRVVTVPLLLALLLAYLFEPLVRVMTRRNWVSRHGAAAAIITALVLGVGVPVVGGVGVGVLQGAGYAQYMARNVRLLMKSVDTPTAPKLRDALPGDSWRSLRDQLVVMQREARRVEGPEDETPKAGGPPGDVTPTPIAPEPGVPAGSAAHDGADAAGATNAASNHVHGPADMARAQAYWIIAAVVRWVQENAESVREQLVASGAGAVQIGFHFVLAAGEVLFGTFLTLFFFFFISSSWGRVLTFGESLIPKKQKQSVLGLIGQMDQVVAGFVRGRVIISAMFMVYFTLAYWLVGVPVPVILGPVVGALCLMPYVSSLGMPAAMLLMLLGHGRADWEDAWWWAILGPVLVHVIGQGLDDYVLTPWIQGRKTGMDMPTILFASIAGHVLAGFYGVLIAIPVAACLKILVQQVVWPRFKAWAEGRAEDPLPIGKL